MPTTPPIMTSGVPATPVINVDPSGTYVAPGGGGGGGAVTVADGANVAQGTTTDAVYTTGAGTLVALLKGLFTKLSGTLTVGGSVSVSNLPATQAVTSIDGGQVSIGTTTDAEATGNGSVIALLKRIRTLLGGTLAVSGTFWQATQPVSGTVALSGTANMSSGATIALTSPQAALNVSADTAYTYASQAKHVLIQNKSTTNVYIEFDATATVGSLLVYPNGQLLFFDIPVTVMHLYSTAATNVNGTADSNIVLKGWA